MSAKYRGMTSTRRMRLAVDASMSGKMSQSEAARLYGVTRSRVNKNVQAERGKLSKLSARSAVAALERFAETSVVPVEAPEPFDEFPLPSGTVSVVQAPVAVVSGEVRRIPPFGEFIRTYFGSLECPDCGRHHEVPAFQDEIADVLTGPEKRVLINVAPYHSKSTLATVQHSVYELCRDPNTRILIVSKSQKLAARFLYQIAKYLSDPTLYPEGSNLVDDWGPFHSGAESWNKEQIYIAGRNSAEKDPSVSALGVGGHIYGIRADTIKFDDIADLENQRNTDRVKEMLTWCTQEAASRVGRSGKLQFIGTRISAGDIYSHLADLPAFRTVRFPCIVDEEAKVTLWPDHFAFENAVMTRDSMTAEQWQLVYQNIDTPGFGASFSPEIVEATYDADRSLGSYDSKWALVAGLDPAGAGAQAGFTAFVLLAVDLESGRRVLVDLVNAKQMKAPQLRDQIFDWADRYPLRELRVEANGLQSQLVQFNEEIMARMTSRGVRVVPHITTGHNKWDPQFGVESMATMFVNRQISLPTQDVASRNRIRPLVEQLLAFPMGAVTDLVMALWFADLGCREVFRRSSVPMFDTRFQLPGRLAGRRRVVDFATRETRAPVESDMVAGPGRPLFPAGVAGGERRLINVGGSVFVP